MNCLTTLSWRVTLTDTIFIWQLYTNYQCKAVGGGKKKTRLLKEVTYFYILSNIQSDEQKVIAKPPSCENSPLGQFSFKTVKACQVPKTQVSITLLLLCKIHNSLEYEHIKFSSLRSCQKLLHLTQWHFASVENTSMSELKPFLCMETSIQYACSLLHHFSDYFSSKL